MNTISIFLYLADVLKNVGTILFLFGWLCLIVAVIWFVCTAIHNDNCGYNWSKGTKKPYPIKQGIKIASLAFTLFIVSSLIPSKDTMYMIAASEIGEQVVTSPEAKEIMNDVHDVIKTQLKKLKE